MGTRWPGGRLFFFLNLLKEDVENRNGFFLMISKSKFRKKVNCLEFIPSTRENILTNFLSSPEGHSEVVGHSLGS